MMVRPPSLISSSLKASRATRKPSIPAVAKGPFSFCSGMPKSGTEVDDALAIANKLISEISGQSVRLCFADHRAWAMVRRQQALGVNQENQTTFREETKMAITRRQALVSAGAAALASGLAKPA